MASITQGVRCDRGFAFSPLLMVPISKLISVVLAMPALRDNVKKHLSRPGKSLVRRR